MFARGVAAAALFALMGPAAGAGDDPQPMAPPVYRPQVCLGLEYESTSLSKHANGSHGTKESWRLRFIAKNDDGSHRVLVIYSTAFLPGDKDGKLTEQPPDVSLASFDLFDDGRIVENASSGPRFHPRVLFPPLPKDPSEVADGWESTGADGERLICKTAPNQDPATGLFTFAVKSEGPMDKVYEATSTARVTLDGRLGMVSKIEREFTQGYGIRSKGTATIALKAIYSHGDEEFAKLAAESPIYFAARQSHDDLLARAETSADPEPILAEALKALEKARASVNMLLLTEQLDRDIAHHKATARSLAVSARELAGYLGKPAAAFETTDLTGHPQSLAAYKGKVVVLDFWYRGCGWCIRAMPQVKGIADDFRDKPVAVLGMNTDDVEADARLVIDVMGLNYPTLKAHGIPEKYGVRGFPTMIVIDQDGKVADIHVGYSKDLHAKVGRSIRRLLDRKAGGEAR